MSQLDHELGVRTLDDLRRAVEDGRLHGLRAHAALPLISFNRRIVPS